MERSFPGRVRDAALALAALTRTALSTVGRAKANSYQLADGTVTGWRAVGGYFLAVPEGLSKVVFRRVLTG